MKKMKLAFLAILALCLTIALLSALAGNGQPASAVQDKAVTVVPAASSFVTPIPSLSTPAPADPMYEIGLAYFNTGDMNGAIRQLQRVDESSAQYAQAQSLIIQARASLRDQQLALVDVYLSANDEEAALMMVEELLVEMPGDTVVLVKNEEILAQIAKRKEETKANVLAQSGQMLTDQDYSAAVALLRGALEQMPEDQELLAACISAELQYKNDYLDRIDALLLDNQNAEAGVLIQTALRIFPDDEGLLSRWSGLRLSEAIDRADQLEKQGDLEAAIACLCDTGEDGGQSPAVIERLNRLSVAYREQIMAEADAAFQTDGYLEALLVVQKGLLTLTDDPQLLDLQAAYGSLAPVGFLDRHDYFEKNNFYVYSNEKDNLGNVYEKVIAPDTSYTNTYITFYVDGAYCRLTGTVYVRYKNRSTDRMQNLRIFGDDLLLYESDMMTGGSLPEDFDINISGVKKIRFETSGSYGVIQIGNLFAYRQSAIRPQVQSKTQDQVQTQARAARTLTCSVTGFAPMTVEIALDEYDRIVSAQVTEHQEVAGFGADLIADTKLFNRLIGQDIQTAQIDVKAGVTVTSNAINDALRMAADMAGE